MVAKFGTSGLRGLTTELVGLTSFNYVDAFVQHLEERLYAGVGDAIYVGWDYRSSSPEIVSNARAAITAQGLTCIDCGSIPTQALALFAMKHRCASIMVTGSHIPADRNGLKFYLPAGEISKEDELRISELALDRMRKPNPPGRIEQAGGPLSEDVMPVFRQRLLALTQSRALRGWSVGIYQHSTVARDLLVDVLEEAGAKCTALGRSETFVPVDTEALSEETIVKLRTWCRTHNFDAIVSADGDGDRPLIADATGEVLRGDLIGLITAKLLGAKHIVTPITSNSGIELNCHAKVTRTRVGSPYVINAMAQAAANGEQAIVGFEANGGFLTATPLVLDGLCIDPLPTRDCFLPILAVLVEAQREGCSLAELRQCYNLPVSHAGRLENFPVEHSRTFMDTITASSSELASFMSYAGQVESVNNVDGIRILLQSGEIVHFRASGNAPEFRCYVEAQSTPRAVSLLNKSLAAVSHRVVPH